MSRGKSVTKLLLDSSQAALFAGIEIHNKPHVDYRYPTTVILIINAWELALKAYVYKYIGKKKIYDNDRKHTISLPRAIALVHEDINKKYKKNEYKAVFENLFRLNDYRCKNVHFIEESLNPVIFMLINQAVLNYDDFLKAFFKRDITKKDNLIIMPVGFKLPFSPVEYLKQDYGEVHNEFVNSVIHTIKDLNDNGIKKSIVVGFNLYTANINKVSNADIVAAIDQVNGEVALTKEVRVTNDPKAPAYRIDTIMLPLRYKDVQEAIKSKRPDIKFNKKFNGIMYDVKNNTNLCNTRYLDPKNKSGSKINFYSEKVVDFVIEEYDKGVNAK